MVKRITSVNVEDDLLNRAKQNLINVSETLEDAIKKKLNIKSVDIEDSNICQFCGKVEEKATKDNLDGLTWLWPDEKWICTLCLKEQTIETRKFTPEKRAEILQLAKNYVIANKKEIMSQMKGKEIL